LDLNAGSPGRALGTLSAVLSVLLALWSCAGSSSEATPAEVTIYGAVVIHAGEGSCTLENVTDLTDPTYLACRDGLLAVLEALEGMGVRAEVELHPGLLSLLARERDRGGLDLEAAIAGRGHSAGLHSHEECLVALGDGELCLGEQSWGKTKGGATPGDEVFALRVRSLREAASRAELTSSSVNIWGWEYRLLADLAAGDDDPGAPLGEAGLGVLVGPGFVVDTPRSAGEGCFDGQVVDELDTYRTTPHPVTVAAGGGELVIYGAASPRWGLSSYSPGLTERGLRDALGCARDRVAAAAYTGWDGQIFTYAGITHLHNILEDADQDGVYDGIEDLEAFLEVADRAAEEESSEAVSLSLIWCNFKEIEALRQELGGDYSVY
jgi:hypothetical protein